MFHCCVMSAKIFIMNQLQWTESLWFWTDENFKSKKNLLMTTQSRVFVQNVGQLQLICRNVPAFDLAASWRRQRFTLQDMMRSFFWTPAAVSWWRWSPIKDLLLDSSQLHLCLWDPLESSGILWDPLGSSGILSTLQVHLIYSVKQLVFLRLKTRESNKSKINWDYFYPFSLNRRLLITNNSVFIIKTKINTLLVTTTNNGGCWADIKDKHLSWSRSKQISAAVGRPRTDPAETFDTLGKRQDGSDRRESSISAVWNKTVDSKKC